MLSKSVRTRWKPALVILVTFVSWAVPLSHAAADIGFLSSPIGEPPRIERVVSPPSFHRVMVGTVDVWTPPEPAPVSTTDQFARLRMCESGGNPSTNTGNGYYGAYQFSPATWRAVGGSGMPHHASLAEQTKRAKIAVAKWGFASQFPGCTRKLGLR